MLELRLFSSEGRQQVRRLMEGSSVLFFKGCTPWQGLLFTGKHTHSLTVCGGEIRSRLDFPEEDRNLRGDSRFLFAVMVKKSH